MQRGVKGEGPFSHIQSPQADAPVHMCSLRIVLAVSKPHSETRPFCAVSRGTTGSHVSHMAKALELGIKTLCTLRGLRAGSFTPVGVQQLEQAQALGQLQRANPRPSRHLQCPWEPNRSCGPLCLHHAYIHWDSSALVFPV